MFMNGAKIGIKATQAVQVLAITRVRAAWIAAAVGATARSTVAPPIVTPTRLRMGTTS